ncbi:hypothetical protein CYLTODRAFT_492301 [Cylindrobasidium torrendii FP15055 ss-10]|uniref:Uncharacterized protein n=1 Tax=Cylindrobasidium torrendii FP15055 ss-10 TaxID=1314674 RepID=A0A0D7B4H4_9AGAR|nr:hypothetical protein CYLTODRAFT_492301 [Cylindrobasidium torrendii FP15055 ss-10]
MHGLYTSHWGAYDVPHFIPSFSFLISSMDQTSHSHRPSESEIESQCITSALSYTSSDNGRTWKRTLYGLEASLGVLADGEHGAGFISAGVLISLPTALSRAEFFAYTINALVILRRWMPQFALTCTSPEPDVLSLVYTVPESTDDVFEWAKSITEFQPNACTLHERHAEVDGMFWRARDGRHVSSAIIGPALTDEQDEEAEYFKDWHGFANSMHGGMDGRGGLRMIDEYCAIMNVLLGKEISMAEEQRLDILWVKASLKKQGVRIFGDDDLSAAPLDLDWGPEVAQLAPAACLLAVQNLGIPVEVLNRPKSRETERASTKFIRPSPIRLEDKSLSSKLSSQTCYLGLTEAQTSRLRQACRVRSVRITSFMSALMCISEVEWALASILENPEVIDDEVRHILELYTTAEVVRIERSAMDQRGQLRMTAKHAGREYLEPSCAADTVPFEVSMDLIREAVQLVDSTGKNVFACGSSASTNIVRKNERIVCYASSLGDVEAHMAWSMSEGEQSLWSSRSEEVLASLRRGNLKIKRDGGALWDAVDDLQMRMRNIDASLWGYVNRNIEVQPIVPPLTPTMTSQPFGGQPGLYATSLGDLKEFGIFTRWAKAASQDDSLIIRDVSLSRRMPVALKSYMCWQWDGKMRIRVATGKVEGGKQKDEAYELPQLRRVWQTWIEEAITARVRVEWPESLLMYMKK